MACGLHPEDCLTDHVLPSVRDARCGTRPGQHRGLCPVCGRDAFSIATGRSARILWTCHAGCTQAAVRGGLLEAGVSEGCLPRMPAKEAASREGSGRSHVLAGIERLLGERMGASAFRLRVAMLVWNTDAKTAAEKLGVSERTRRRLSCPPGGQK